MKDFTSNLLIGAFLVLIAMPDDILATPLKLNSTETCHPVVHKTCGTWCENNCEQLNAESLPCDWTTCRPGYYCKPGYVKELMYGYGRCILPSECPVNKDTTVSPVTESNEDTTVLTLVTQSNEVETTVPSVTANYFV